MTDQPENPMVVAMQQLQDMVLTVTATIGGVCNQMRESGIDEPTIQEFARRMAAYLADQIFGTTP